MKNICPECGQPEPKLTFFERLKEYLEFLWIEWKYRRLPEEEKKKTLRYKISEAYKESERTGLDQTIYINPGKYHENLTLSEGVNLTNEKMAQEED